MWIFQTFPSLETRQNTQHNYAFKKKLQGIRKTLVIHSHRREIFTGKKRSKFIERCRIVNKKRVHLHESKRPCTLSLCV